MKFIKNGLFLLTFSLLISSCATSKNDDSIIKKYSNDKVKLDIRNQMNGNLKGFGIWQDKNGIIIKKFTVEISGSWEGDKGVVKQQFSFDNEKKDSRTWLFDIENDNSFSAIGHDIVGTAKGVQYGNASKMNYILSVVAADGKKQNLAVEDWTYAVNDKSLISVLTLKNPGYFSGNEAERIIMSLKKVDSSDSKASDNIKNSAKSLDKNIEEK